MELTDLMSNQGARFLGDVKSWLRPPDRFSLDTEGLRDLLPAILDEHGQLRVLPAAFWAGTTKQERAWACLRLGVYSIPTAELVEYLREVIGDRSAIEVGAGNGVLAAALGIPATDNRMQEDPEVVADYMIRQQVPVKYGEHVKKCHASRAVRQYKPQVVIGCWVTQAYKADGVMPVGVDERDVIRNCGQYVLVGNEEVHADKVIWSLPHAIVYPDWLYSRAMNGSRDFIATWRGRPAQQVRQRVTDRRRRNR